MKKGFLTYIVIGIIVILIIAGIFYFKNDNSETIDSATMQCIADNSIVYSSKTCSFCKKQAEVLGDYYSMFNVTDCFYESEKCRDAEIPGTPTWIINGTQYPGLKSIEELKTLTGC